jgi:hypothetical protein
MAKTTKTTKTTTDAAPAKAKRSTRATEEQLHAKQAERLGKSNIVPGSLRFEEEGTHKGKQTVEINTVGVDGSPDGNTRRVATSDLFQVFNTVEVAAELKKAKRRAAAKARRELAKANAERLAELEAANG